MSEFLKSLMVPPVSTETPQRKLRRKKIIDRYFKKGKTKNVDSKKML